MSRTVGLVVCAGAAIYDHGPQHPLRPERVLLTWKLIEAYGLDRLPNVTRMGCDPAADDELELVHTRDFIEATKKAGEGERGPFAQWGYGPGDNPIFPRMHEAGALVAGATRSAAQAVWEGNLEHAFNAAGGLHHSMPSRASGFCVYNDPAVAIAWLLKAGAKRVAYVDVDVHHGDGVQAIFYSDPRVLTASIHESGSYLFPGTGFADETGSGEGTGTAINVPLEPGTGDEEWLEAFRGRILPAVRDFEPEVLLTQLGCDTHLSDPLANLRLTTRAYREAARDLHRLAHEEAGGRWVATGGGGYQWASVVPRAWTIAFAEMAGVDIADELPRDWVDLATAKAGSPIPETLSEEAS